MKKSEIEFLGHIAQPQPLLVCGVINKQNSTDWADMGHLIQSSSSVQSDLPTSPAFNCQQKIFSGKMSEKKTQRGTETKSAARERKRGQSTISVESQISGIF